MAPNANAAGDQEILSGARVRSEVMRAHGQQQDDRDRNTDEIEQYGAHRPSLWLCRGQDDATRPERASCGARPAKKAGSSKDRRL
jgi:hypothetical protein